MSSMLQAKQEIIQELKQSAKGLSPTVGDLQTPPDSSMGDLAFPCFELGKKRGQSPAEIAAELAAQMAPTEHVSKITAVGPYVNFTLSDQRFAQETVAEVLASSGAYGHSGVGKGKRVMVEFANLNSHKDVHIGHLRNLVVGQMTVNTLKALGFDVVPVSYINDLGTHVAKSVWAMKRFHAGERVSSGDEMRFLRDVYVEGTKKAEEIEGAKEEISDIFRDLEDQKGPCVSLWRKTREWSLDYLRDVYDEMGLTIQDWYFESDLISETKRIIDELIKQGIVVKSDGAWIIDLEEENLGVNLLVKSDGTLLYNAKDLALARVKERDHHPQRSIYVIDTRQSHVMKQLFATLPKMGFEKELTHLAYDFVTTKDGAMAARTGNVIRYEEFRDRMVELVSEETRQRHEDWTEAQVARTAKAIAFAAMKFSMLKQDLEKKVVFDMEEALSVEGFTGPYLLYTYARIQSLLKKAAAQGDAPVAGAVSEEVEHRLVVALARYPEVLFKTGESLKLSLLAHELFSIAKIFSELYGSISMLSEEDREKRQARLALAQATAQVLENGLTLMGIGVVDEM